MREFVLSFIYTYTQNLETNKRLTTCVTNRDSHNPADFSIASIQGEGETASRDRFAVC